MEIISGESNPLVELKVSTAKRLSGKLDASPERVLREIPIRIMQEVNTNKEQNNISPESRMLKENERCLFQHNIKPIFRRTRKSDVQHQLAERLEPKTRKLSTGRFSLGLSLGSNAKVSTTARLEESVALKGKNSMKNVKRRNKLLATGNSVENDKNLLGAPAVSAVESTCIKPHCDGMSEMNISAMTETRAENVAPSRCNTLLEAEKEDQMSRSEMYNSPKPFSFNATVEELGITPSVFTSTSAEKGKSPASLHKLRRRSTIGLRGSPETNCLIRYIAQQRSLALGSPLSPDFMYRSRDNSALKEKIRAFRRSFQSVDENDRPAPSHDHIEGREPDKGFKEMPTYDKKSGQSTDNQKAMESCQLLESTMGKNLFTTDLVPELFDKMLPSKTLLRKGGTLVFVPVSSSPCKILEKTPINDAFPQPSFDISEECLEPTAKEMVNIIASDLVETPSSAPQSSDSVRGPTADYPSLPDFKSPNMAESSDDFLGTKCVSSQKPHFDVRETPAVETAGASDGTEISKVENVSDSTAVSQEDQPRLRLRRKCAEQSSNGNSSTSKKPKSDTTARKAPKTIKKTSAAVTRKSQASKRNGKHTRKGKKSGTRKQIYGAREFASKKPILSPIVEIPETLSPASNCDTPRDQKAASKGKVVVTPYYGKHPSNVHSKRVCNMASGASSCVMKADIKICLGQSQKFIVKNDIDISQNDQESLQDHTLKILNCPETDSEASDKHEVLQITEDVMRNEHPSSDMTSCHENKKRSSRRSLAASSERGEMVLVKEPLGAVVDLERVKPIECDGGSNSVTSENDTAKIHTEVVGKSDYEQQISADKCGNAIIVCSSGTTKNVVKMKKRRNLKPSEMVFVAEITHESSETGISLEANVSHAVKSFVSEDVEDIAVNVEGAQTLTSFFSPKMEIKKGKRRSALTRLSLGQEESNEMNSSLQDCHMTALEVESIYDSKVNCRKPSGRRRSSIYCPSENKNAHSVTIVSNNCESSGDICMSSTHRRDDQPYADSITYTDGDLQMSQPSGSASEKRKVRRSMRLRRESDIIGLDWIQSSPSKTDDSESLLDMTSGKSRRRTLHVSSLQNSDCMTQSRRNRRASLVLQKTSCESKAIREESMLNMFAL
ncbi:cell division cycle-associated protein 2 [Protopterus annectens]|uniref:cell division cycle-associated protein 2 n=1 Tax=Protopterus annectens TaxID=7888 RepID=UPI001CFBC52C|nr:cell division cycle-associated protein 2 [Protopterus annectens]